MRAHVFITNKDTFPVVRDNSFWGVGIRGIPDSFDKVIKENLKSGKKLYIGSIADMLTLRVGNIVFLYECNEGND